MGIDELISQLQSHLSHMSSVLLTGALGSGKSSVSHLLAHNLRSEMLFHTTYFSCRKLVTDETRVSTIKETFTRIFMCASWGARLGGKSLVILDDLDKLCPVETELEVSENGRSRQISECLCALVRQYCGRDSGVVLLATAQAKESLHNVIVGGHVVREIVGLKAPNKEGRRRVMEMVVRQNMADPGSSDKRSAYGSRPATAYGSASEGEDGGWMEVASGTKHPASPSKDGFLVSPDLDFLDLAGETDGYMPGDLVLLVARARSEALIRSVSQAPKNAESRNVQLGRYDFISALKGFTPASLRNVTLQTTTTTFFSSCHLAGPDATVNPSLKPSNTQPPMPPSSPNATSVYASGFLLHGYPGCGENTPRLRCSW